MVRRTLVTRCGPVACAGLLIAGHALAAPVLDLSGYRQALPDGAAANVVTNGGFDEGAAGWPLVKGYSFAPGEGHDGGALVYERSDPALYPLPNQVLPLKPGTRYRFSAWVRTDSVTQGDHGGATLCIQYTRNGQWIGGVYPPGLTGTNDWTRVESFCTVPLEADQCHTILYMRQGATGKAWFDDVTVEATKARWVVALLGRDHERIPPDD